MASTIKAFKIKHRLRQISLLIVLMAVIIGGGFLTHAAMREKNAYQSLMKDLNLVASMLRNQGVSTVKVSSGCGQPDEEFAKGAKHCAAVVETLATNEQDYIRAIEKYRSVLDSSAAFKLNTSKLVQPTNNVELQYGSAGYKYGKTGQECGVVYSLISKPSDDVQGHLAHYTVQFSCDDTSWFVKTFEN